MNDNVKGLVGFVIGAAISGVSVWLYQDKRLSDQFLKEIDDYKKSLVGTPVEKGDEIPESALKAAEAIQKNAETKPVDPQESLKRPVDTRKTNYSKLTRNYRTSDRNDTEESLKEDNESMKVNAYYISEDEYYSEDVPVGYKFFELFLSADDKELFDKNGDLFVDPQTAFGWDLYEEIKKAHDPVYVRNDDLKEMYSIDIEE